MRAGAPLHSVEFRVPPEHWNAVFVALQPAKRDPRPAKWAVFGALEVTMTDHSQVVVSLFELPGDEPGAFSCTSTSGQRRYFRGGNSADLRRALLAAYEASRDH